MASSEKENMVVGEERRKEGSRSWWVTKALMVMTMATIMLNKASNKIKRTLTLAFLQLR
jgi:hypothetical protein